MTEYHGPVLNSPADTRVRFCPSPTGTPHVGMVRTALFNWAYARHTGGKLIFRIEDTDAARDSEESFNQVLESLHWLGINWDEGVGVGGPHEPYRQSERKTAGIYNEVFAKLIEGGYVYEDFSTPDEVKERRKAAGQDPQLGYDNYDRNLTEEQKEAYRAEGRKPVWRLRMPDEDINKKLSKRDPESNLFLLRDSGFIKEGLLNYLSLLGWSLSADQDVFSIDELVEHFDVHDVVANPARFDVKKAESINGDHIRALDPKDFRDRLIPYLQAAGVLGETLTEREEQVLTEAAPLVQERMQLLGEAPGLLAFLFKADEEISTADDARKQLKESAPQVLAAAIEALEPLEDFTAANIEAALRAAIVDGLEIKPRLAFGPVRIAVSGERISPPLFESMEILGKESSLARLRKLAAELS